MIRLRNFTLSGILVGTLILGGAACSCREKVAQKVTEKALEKAIQADAKSQGKDVNVDVNLKGGSMSIKSKDGKDDVDIQMKDGKMSIKNNEGDQQLSVDNEKQIVTMTSKDGTLTSMSGPAAKLPENFPKDVPMFAGATIENATAMTQKEMFSVQAVATDSLANVGEYFKKEFAEQGWAETQTMNQDGDEPMQMLTYSKADRMAMVMLTVDEQKTRISIQTGKN